MAVARRAVVVGAGIFGVTAARELRRRGWDVTLLDAGPLPHPLAASTDLSKAVRLEYGSDEAYTAMAEEALEGFRRWDRDLGASTFHETGVLFLRREAMAPGTFEGDSWEVLRRRGHAPERMGPAEVAARFPAWRAAAHADGFFHARGGWVEAGRLVGALLRAASAEGVALHPARLAGLLEDGGRVTGVQTDGGASLAADAVVVAAGSWTQHALPWLAASLRSTGQPVFHLRPADPDPFRPPRFCVFGADISSTGWYGFPLHEATGVVKVANHGPGRAVHPDGEGRAVTPAETEALRVFLRDALPPLAGAPIVHTRVCVYSDTWDGHFWIAADPDRPGLVVSAGGSGHAYKFAPLLGALAADAVEGVPDPRLARFRWRPEVRPRRALEEARFQS